MKHFLIRVATPIVLIVLWQLFADAFGSPRMPRPSAVVASAMKLIGSGELVTALVTSLCRTPLSAAADERIRTLLGGPVDWNVLEMLASRWATPIFTT